MKNLVLNATLLIAGIAGVTGGNVIQSAKAGNKPLNFLLISTDHELTYGYGTDVDYYHIKKPNFDRFCREAVRFTNAKTVCPLCSPARRSILNGLYPHNHGVVTNDSALEMYTNQETIYDEYLANGFSRDNLFFYGKTHYGGSLGGITPESTYSIGGWAQGGYGQPYTTQEYANYLKRNNYFGSTYRTPTMEIKSTFAANGNPVPGTTYTLSSMKIITGNFAGVAKTPKEFHECYFLADLANTQLKKLANEKSEKPFVMTVNIWGPHHPYYPSKEFVDMYTDEKGVIGGNIAQYPSFVDCYENKAIVNTWDTQTNISPSNFSLRSWSDYQTYLGLCYAQHTQVDAAIGTILDTLEETGLDENTVVIWTNDHGDAAGTHGGHADKECYLTEEINAINLVYKNPTMKEYAGTTCDHFVCNIDTTVTMLAEYGLKLNNPDVYGQDLKKFITGELSPRKTIVSETHGHFSSQIGRSIYFENYKYNFFQNDIDEFYDLKTDPYEMNNLIFDKTKQGIIAYMKSELKKWQIETRDPFGFINL